MTVLTVRNQMIYYPTLSVNHRRINISVFELYNNFIALVTERFKPYLMKKRGCEHASRTKRRRSLTMPSCKTYKKSSLQKIYLCEKSVFAGNPFCRKSIFAGNLSLREIYLCRKSVFGGIGCRQN